MRKEIVSIYIFFYAPFLSLFSPLLGVFYHLPKKISHQAQNPKSHRLAVLKKKPLYIIIG